MARINNLTNFLTDVAAAIKEKKGSATDIPAANFDTEILALPSQGVYESRTVTIAQNGSQTITPNQGYDAIDEITIITSVPETHLQTKNYSFNQNTTTTLTPESGYDGFSSVGLTIAVPSSQLQTKSYSFTQNNTSTLSPDSGYDGFSSVGVTVNVPMENTSDYATCLQLANAILGDVELLDDPYVTYNVTVNVTNADQIAITNRDLVITTPGGV